MTTHIHRLSVADALASLNSTENGLSSSQAERREREYGPNRVEEIRRRHAILALLREFTRFFSTVLWVAATLAFFVHWKAPGQGMERLGFAIIVVILVSGVFSYWQERRAEKALAALRELLPGQAVALRDGGAVQIAAERIVPGDIIVLEAGDNVPADCRLIEAFGARVNNATVTGESVPRARESSPSEHEDPLRSRNILLAGTSLVSGRAKAVVFATGMHTEFGRIAHLTQAAGEPVSPLRLQIAHLSRVIIALAVAIAAAFLLAGHLIGISFWETFLFAIGIIVAMVPEGLQPTLTLSLVLAAQRMAKRHVLIRHLASVETLGSTTVICTDKTGTLTQNRMTVRALFLGGRHEDEPATVADRERRYAPFFHAAALCHDLTPGTRAGLPVLLGDPMEVALAELGRTTRDADHGRRVSEIPFDAERMRLSVVHETPQGRVLYCKGAPETVLPLCTHALAPDGVEAMSDIWRRRVITAQQGMAARGLRVLAFAYRPLASEEPAERNLIFAGLAGLEDPPRPEVRDAIRLCREAGIKVIMVTGDHPETAAAIAREIGLTPSPDPVVIDGAHLRRLSDTQLQLTLDSPDIIFARVGADQKTRIVGALKRKGHIVAATGDGVNDAPALKSAHIGIAMGIVGTDVAKEAADMVLLDDNFASIVNAIEEGRVVFANIRKFLTYILAHNVPELVPYLGLVLFKIPLALTPLQMLSIDMGTDSLTALGLGVEGAEPQVMRQPPRPTGERLFSLGLALRAYLFLGLFEALAAMAAFFFVLKGAGWSYGQTLAQRSPVYLAATTATLATIVVMQIVNVFLCRSDTRSAFATGQRRNRLILAGVVFEIALILAIAYTRSGNRLLGTAPVEPNAWLFIVPFAAALLLLEEGRKAIVRRLRRITPGTASAPRTPIPAAPTDAAAEPSSPAHGVRHDGEAGT